MEPFFDLVLIGENAACVRISLGQAGPLLNQNLRTASLFFWLADSRSRGHDPH